MIDLWILLIVSVSVGLSYIVGRLSAYDKGNRNGYATGYQEGLHDERLARDKIEAHRREKELLMEREEKLFKLNKVKMPRRPYHKHDKVIVTA